MTAQRILSNQVVNGHYSVVQEAVKLLGFNRPLQRMIWVCDTCGMRYLSTVPAACDSCGATHLSLQQDTNQEISRRG
ncbi:MAG TPA: hypothetical protein VKR06_41125 [Ktedonosporobacter sp.]|nr:hypothetical protein [Ktedonosporobacter sp.]